MTRPPEWFARLARAREAPIEARRGEMLARLRAGGVVDPAVLEAMRRVPRERFVEAESEGDAYADRALAIGCGQTISQPLMVAIIAQALEIRPGERVLDVGTGSGYQAAVLAACGAQVVSVERIPELATTARQRLAELGADVDVRVGDGSAGLPGERFDGIAVGAAAPRVPRGLLESLADGGRLVIPVTRSIDGERLERHRRRGDEIVVEDLGACRFVPLIGREGYQEE